MNQQFSIDKPTRASGRFGRLSYLAWLLISSIIFMVVAGILVLIFGSILDAENPANYSIPAIIIMVIAYIALIYFNIIFMIRRLHDRNHSGWLSLLLFVPVLNIIFALYLIFAKGDAVSNDFGAPRITPGWEKVAGWLYILMIPLAGGLAAISLPAYQSYIEQIQHVQPETQHTESSTQE